MDSRAEKDLLKLDKTTQKEILEFLRNRIENRKIPVTLERLKGNLAGLWKYRVRDYRIIVDIQDDKVVVLVLRIGHRRKIYGGH